MPARVSLVTGAAGFIGAHLVRRLLSRGERVHAIVRPSTQLDRLEPVLDEITLHRVDLVEAALLQDCLGQIKPTHVFHLAADTRPAAASAFAAMRQAVNTNLGATLNLVEALAGLATPPAVMVRAATLAEYGSSQVASREVGPALPDTIYGASMLATTAAVRALAPALRFPVIHARLALCYGYGQSRAFLVSEAIHALLDGQPVTLARPADRRDLIHVDDAVAGLLALADIAPADCPVVNIGTGKAPAMNDVIERVRALIDGPAQLVVQAGAHADQAPSCLQTDPDLAWQRLGWRTRIDIEEGLQATIAAEREARTRQPVEIEA